MKTLNGMKKMDKKIEPEKIAKDLTAISLRHKISEFDIVKKYKKILGFLNARDKS